MSLKDRFLLLKRVVLLFWMFGGFGSDGFSQALGESSSKDTVARFFIVREVRITGNKITRPEIIARELPFRNSDTLVDKKLANLLKEGRQNVFNTNLFNFVTVDTIQIPESRMVDVLVTVAERWYIWPIPFFQLADRNFNAWLQARDPSRLTWGIDFKFFNVRGRNETLKIMTHFGYNQLYGFEYKVPYINKSQTIGLKFGFDADFNHELAVMTMNNKPVFLRNNMEFLQQRIVGFAEMTLRPDFFTSHSFQAMYNQYEFADQVDTISGFLLEPSEPQKFLQISYLFKLDHRDVQYYPLTGYYFDTELTHAIPFHVVHNSYLTCNLRYYRHLTGRWFFAAGFTGKLAFARQQPYYLQRGLGYGRDFVRGYEYYVVDGQHYALVKSNLKFVLVPQRTDSLRFLRSFKFNTIPWALYLNAFFDAGYVYNYQNDNGPQPASGNTLENKFLPGFGLGVDFTTYYDVVIRVECAMNVLGQTGVYLHFIAPI